MNFDILQKIKILLSISHFKKNIKSDIFMINISKFYTALIFWENTKMKGEQ